MSAVIAEGRDGEPGGLDAAETVMQCEARKALQFAEIDLAGKTAWYALSFKDGLAMAALLVRERKAGGH